MRRVVAAVGMITAVAPPALGQNGSAGTRPPSGDERGVLQRERDMLSALTRGDAKALDRILAADVSATSPGGWVAAKRDILADAKPNGNATFDATRLRARAYGDAAVVTGVMTVRSKQGDQEASQYFRITDTFVRRRNEWQLVATQQTRVPVWQTREMDDRELTASTALDCGRESSLRSLNGDVATYLKFTNSSARTVVVHWLNYEGKRDPAADQVMTLGPGRSEFRFTYVTHPFVATDAAGMCLGVYQPAREPSLATFR